MHPRHPGRAFQVVLLALVLAAGCTNDTLDDGDGADVVLQIETLQNPSVTAALDSTTGVCTFTIANWQFGAKNLPKNTSAEASSPFNDIAMQRVTIAYAWINPAFSTPTREFGLGGVVVPVDDTVTIEFQPIAFDDLSGALSGSTANLTLDFEGRTVEGTRIVTRVLRALSVESCI